MYNAISLITEDVNFKRPIFNDEHMIELVKSKIDVIYKQIKKMKLDLRQIIYLIIPLQEERKFRKHYKKIR